MEGQKIVEEEEEESAELTQECSLCQWAKEGNSSLALEYGNAEENIGVGGLLAGVAVGSAITGAILTAVLIRCRRSQILPTGKDGCPVLSRASWGATKENSPPTEDTPNTATTSRTGWAMKLWRRASSQESPLQPSSSSYSSENSYTEEPYMCPEVQSAVYAELSPSTNTYSEIPDPGRPENQRRKIPPPDTEYAAYGNGGFCLTESVSDQAESSSTPSSAYYSDVSADLQAHKKKRKKKKVNGRDVEAPLYNIKCVGGAPSISSTVPIVQSRITDPVIPLSGETYHQNTSLCEPPLQLSLSYLSRSYSLARPTSIQLNCTTCHNCTPISTLPIVRHSCPLPTNPNIGLHQRTQYSPNILPMQQHQVQNTAQHLVNSHHERILSNGPPTNQFFYTRDPPPCCSNNSKVCVTSDCV